MRRLRDSRIIRLALIGIFILFGIKLISYALIFWIIELIKREAEDSLKIEAYSNLVRILSVSISGAIATIISAVAVRYGAREALRNIGNNAGDPGGELK